MPENNPDNWKRMSFKGNKVWMETCTDGTPLLEKGKVRIKYNLDQDYQYYVHPESLKSDDPANLVPAGQKKQARSDKQPSASSGKPSFTENDVIHAFTDGASSGNPGPAGIGILLRFNGHEKEISRNIGTNTNNVAELEAIRVALTEIKKRELPVRVYTDSSYAIGVLSRNWKAKKNTDLIDGIKTLMSCFSNLTFVKVEGHAGIEENERADHLATSAIASK
jgi:ribonuclease HI